MPLISVCVLILVSCGKEAGPEFVLIPQLNESGDTALIEAKIETLSDPHVAEGPVAIVYENPLLTSNGVSGSPAEPRLSQSDQVWIPLDISSSSALAIYYGLEQIKKFDDRVIPEFSVTWPRRVVFDLNIAGSGVVNNAFYFGQSDIMAIVPYTMGGLPVAFNSGILAHEHFHAHFHKLLGERVLSHQQKHFENLSDHLHAPSAQANCGLNDLEPSKIKSSDEDFIQIVNTFILRGWNEGLADFYASMVTGMPNSFDQTLNLEGSRKIDEKPGAILSREVFEVTLSSDLNSSLGKKSSGCQILGLSYFMGTQVARSLYEKAKPENQKALRPEDRERAVRLTFQKLRNLITSLESLVKLEKLSPSWIVEKLSEELRPDDKIDSSPPSTEPSGQPQAI